ncbi:MAG: hypothetical protein JNM03_09760 [Sphingopyxis sp.]|uniref:hypothetical protein n=1 Tax=Sphingopyxis sp. TaxID=1908224 RepID=UPI001A4DFEDC|nr:hypothetical protein [Sphingopyxis sp.]MBL9070263.1 hypothetical protein [Sphingopyxis sp.]
MRIIMHGPGSRAAGTVKSRRTARTLKRINENEGKITAATSEEALVENAEDLATLTISFENLSHGDLTGEQLFLAVYSDPELGYITAQAERHFNDWGKYKPGSAGN